MQEGIILIGSDSSRFTRGTVNSRTTEGNVTDYRIDLVLRGLDEIL